MNNWAAAYVQLLLRRPKSIKDLLVGRNIQGRRGDNAETRQIQSKSM